MQPTVPPFHPGHPPPGAGYPYGGNPPGGNPYGSGYPSPYGGHFPAPDPYGTGYPSPYGRYPPPRVGLPRPVAVAPVDGTPYAVALVDVRPSVSGPAVASLVTGIGSILVCLVVGFFAAVGARPGWGAAVAGAFAILATLLSAAAILLHRAALGRIRASAAWGPTRGRGMATGGLVCGLTGAGLTVLIMLAALAG